MNHFSCHFRMSASNVESFLNKIYNAHPPKSRQALAKAFFAESYLEPTFDNEGNIIDLISTDNNGAREQESFLESIQEFVEPGSYVEFMGYGGSHWRWRFEETGMRLQTPTVTWD